MQEEQLLTIQQYATKYKMSTFSVIKRINTKVLKTIKRDDGEWILDESIAPKSLSEQNVFAEKEEGEPIDYERAFHALFEKYIALQEKYTQLMETKNISKE
ncbi:hypothetical protein [Sulfurospirillum deleyianum]|uniref:Uncharacterized protein n=1 Tax=Sulfurospirillum deleyianum (strain ATCC 51133 / DSM 6946 / 5175) TaxID=525898 RepID=D1B1P0_SULD5|nr:hypothetical protein [Sulfurospirillum deleyianum]ACZ12010.1 hypothetical protein Sdel_0981 [Sulfurospirillum deleyianum DSM 6946]